MSHHALTRDEPHIPQSGTRKCCSEVTTQGRRSGSRLLARGIVAAHGSRSFEAFVAFVDRMFYMCIAAFALCVASMLMP